MRMERQIYSGCTCVCIWRFKFCKKTSTHAHTIAVQNRVVVVQLVKTFISTLIRVGSSEHTDPSNVTITHKSPTRYGIQRSKLWKSVCFASYCSNERIGKWYRPIVYSLLNTWDLRRWTCECDRHIIIQLTPDHPRDLEVWDGVTKSCEILSQWE